MPRPRRSGEVLCRGDPMWSPKGEGREKPRLRLIVRVFCRWQHKEFHLLEHLLDRGLITRNVASRIFGRVAMPSPQVVVTEDPLLVAYQGKVSTVILRVIENVDESLFTEPDSDLDVEIFPLLDDGERSLGKGKGGCLSDPVCKL